MTQSTIDILKTGWLFPTESMQAFRNERLSREAEAMAARLRVERRLPVWEAQDSPAVLTGRRFFKQLPAIADPRMAACRRELLAVKLGISSEVFDHNPGFEKFAADSHMERYLLEYHHQLRVDPKTKKLSILVDGHYLGWDTAHEAMSRFPRHTGSPLLPWMYGPEGIQNDDMYDWIRMKPYKHANPEEWGRRYVYELVVCCGNTPHKTGDHGWLRLRTPEGDMYSVGLYRPGKRGFSDNWKAPFRIKRGHLMMPDVSEFWPSEIRSVRIGITEAQFHQMIAVIEHDKAQDQLIFQLFHSNCVLWAAHVAHEAGVEVPVGACSVARLLTPRRFEPLLDKANHVVPAPLVAVAERTAALALNSLQLALGAGMVDRDVTAHNGPTVRPHIASLREVLDPEKMVLHHPSTFGNDTLREIQKWRAKRIDELRRDPEIVADPERLRQAIDDVQYQVPMYP
jgi:hypothetical protein